MTSGGLAAAPGSPIRPADQRPIGPVDDPAERVASVLRMKRELLLAFHRHRLGREDLEDCLSQAALELLGRARAGQFADDGHIANALEQKFLSRVTDRQRALAGRSAMVAATHDAVRLGATGRDDEPAFDVAAADGEPSTTAANRERLQQVREVAAELTDDQRLVLACQVSLGIESAEFCRRFGWSPDKFKKVAQRARARLTKLVSEYEAGDRCRRLEADVLAYAAHVASAAQMGAVREHLANCIGCAAYVRDVRVASRSVAAVLPVPALASHAVGAKLGVAAKLDAVWRAVTAPFDRIGASGASSIGAGGLAKAGLATVGIAALAAGGHVGARRPEHPPRAAAAHHAQAVVARGMPTTRTTTRVTDVLRPAGISRSRTNDGNRRPRAAHPRRRPRRERNAPTQSTVARAATGPPPAPPLPATAPPTPSQRVARSVQLPPPPARVTKAARKGRAGTEFGVE